MKKSLIVKGLISLLIVFIFGLTAIGCEFVDKIINNGDNVVDDGSGNGNTTDDGKDDITDDGKDDTTDDGKDDNVEANKTALEAEIALEVAEQGDYTLASYEAYAAKLAEAKAIAADKTATQEAVDAAVAALTAARQALVIRPIEEVADAEKAFRVISGNTKEIVIADYVNANGLSKITYQAKTNNAVVELGKIAEGKFIITAGEVREETDVTVSIIVSYNGVEKLTVELAVKISNDTAPVVRNEAIEKNYDLFDLEDDKSFVIDFSENVDNAGGLALTYKVKCGEADLTLDGTRYTLNLGNYTEEYAYQTFTVTVYYVANGEEGTITYTYKLGFRDTRLYRVAGGDFENGVADGWTAKSDEGAEQTFGGVDNRDTFWIQAFPMFNVGKYFTSEGRGNGSLASPYFVVNSQYATYMIGSAGKQKVYITIENEAGKVIALYRNTKFADFPGDVEANKEMIGDTVFVCNFVTYKVDLSAFQNQKIRFVIHDHEEDAGFGFVYFDELNTFYAPEDKIPENAVLAENLLADKTTLNAEIANAILEQGDYTEDSYIAYAEKLAAAKALAGDVAATKEDISAAIEALTAAHQALEVRPIIEIKDANKSFKLFSGNNQEIVISDYINENHLSKITYEIKANSEIAVLSAIADGKFTITAGEVSEPTVVTVSIIVSYDGVEKLTINLTVNITNDLAPTVKNSEVSKSYDIYMLDNKESILVDFSENIENPGNLELSYSINGVYITTPIYVYNFTYDYTEKEIGEMFSVTVSYVANGVEGSIKYEYVLNVRDTTKYRMENGGFENGLDGWTVVGNIGDVSSDSNYWINDPESAEGFAFGKDGEKMFSAYVEGAYEGAVGTLTSPSFKVGGSGYVSFKIGGMKDGNYVYIDVVDAETKEILARYYNGLWAERTDGVKSGCTLVEYKANLSAFKGREVFFRISDNADSGYGLFFADSFVTYYYVAPWELSDATPVDYEVSGTIYDIFNGGFEMGDNQGWWNVGEPGKVTGADAFFSGVAYGKDGNYLYSGVEDHGAGNGREGNTGVLTSSVFEIGGSGYITYMLGGGNGLCYVQVIDSTTGEVLARYRQQAREDAVLKSYVADLTAYVGRTVRIQLVDNATSGWGCVSFDGVKTYYESKPEGFIDAIDVKYEIANGSFEIGNKEGWKQNGGNLGEVINNEINEDWYTKNDETKDGKYVFSFAFFNAEGGVVNVEGNTGNIESSNFFLKQNAYVSFRFGGAGNVQNHDVYIQLCKANGEVIATFYNDAAGKVNTKMNAYYYQYTGEESDCFFRVVDNSTGDYGCFVVDDFRVNLESAPEGFIAAIQ